MSLYSLGAGASTMRHLLYRMPRMVQGGRISVRSKGGPSHLEYRSEFLGQGVRFSFPVVHLSQWLGRWDELESLGRTNPFAVVIMAQLRQIQRRFGAASDEIANRISKANSQQLETWSLNIPDAKTLDEVFLG